MATKQLALPTGGEVKPLMRGQIHRVAFFAYILIAAFFAYVSKEGVPRIAVIIYMATLINLYGISSVLHITSWKDEKLEERVQRVDHASIFLLIAGSYTPICMSCLPPEPWALYIMGTAWLIAIAGIIKSILWINTPKVFNVSFYFVCGLTIVPFFPRILPHITPVQVACFIAGGICYLAGGVIFGIEYPDPSPKYFGFHEIFHTLTIVANVCFMIPMMPCILK